MFFNKDYDDFNRYFIANANIEYGFSDDRLRVRGSLTYKFNNTSKSFLTLTGGIKVEQFNPSNLITAFGNSLATLFFEENYIKLYEQRFIQARYSEELVNGLRFSSNLSYENRGALFNTTDQTFYPNSNKDYFSNSPLDPKSADAPFINHNIVKLNLSARIHFDQDYISYPDRKVNLSSEKFPTLVLGYEKGLGATISNDNFDQIKARLSQSFSVKDKSRFNYNLRAGKFLNAEDIAFIDFQHLNGNQINISRRGNYTDVFNNLGYYDLNTNDSYIEMHAENDFNGFILGKIPQLNKLNFN